MPKPLSYSRHALDVIAERKLDLRWIERTVREPEWFAGDPRRPGVERRFRAVQEYGGRMLRVACYETETEIRIITVFFDRDARRLK